MGAKFGPRSTLQLVAVDENGSDLGTVSMADAHMYPGIRHRAFSAYLFNSDGHLLVHQRSREKALWTGFWTNSCCSHPRAGQELSAAVTLRIQEELGAAGVLCQERFAYEYRAEFKELGVEHEFVHVMTGSVEARDLSPDPTEVAKHRFLAPEDVDALIAGPTPTTPWFELAWERMRSSLEFTD